MVKGETPVTPTDGLTTRQRRRQPLVIAHTGAGKGKSTAAFGLALRGWAAGWSVAVFQFVKSAKWRIGEQTALEALGQVHTDTGHGGAIEWHKMGSGWSWTRKSADEDPSLAAKAGWQEVQRRLAAQTHQLYILDEFAYVMNWGWVDVDEVVQTLSERPGVQHVVITGRNMDPKILDIADVATEMTKLAHPFDRGQRGQRGIEW